MRRTMAVTRHTYATREQLMLAAEWSGSPTDADRLLDSHSGKVDELFHRRFHPRIYTRRYDWPARDQVSHSILWLDDDLLEVIEFLASGETIDPADYFLGPDDPDLECRDRLELDRSTSATLGAGGQRSLEVEALWGYSRTEGPAGTITTGVNDSVTTVPVSNAALVGVGDLLRIGTERVIVTDRAYVATGVTLAGALGGSSADAQLTVSSGAGLHVGEAIQIDAEQMRVVTIVSNTVTAERAVNGTSLDDHDNGAAILAPRSLTVVRGAYGTTAASHLNTAPATRNVPPGLITDLVIAECIAQRVQESGGYNASVGPGGNTTPDRIALLDIRARARDAYARSERVFL